MRIQQHLPTKPPSNHSYRRPGKSCCRQHKMCFGTYSPRSPRTAAAPGISAVAECRCWGQIRGQTGCFLQFTEELRKRPVCPRIIFAFSFRLLASPRHERRRLNTVAVRNHVYRRVIGCFHVGTESLRRRTRTKVHVYWIGKNGPL